MRLHGTAEHLRPEVDGVAEQVQLDSVHVVAVRHLVDQPQSRASHQLMLVVDRAPPALVAGVARELAGPTHQQFRVIALEPRGALHHGGIVGVVHAHRPEQLHAVAVAEVDHDLQAVAALPDQPPGVGYPVGLAGPAMPAVSATVVRWVQRLKLWWVQ